MNSTEFNDWVLVSLSPLSAWQLTILCSLTLIATVFLLWSYRHNRRSGWLMGLRVCTGLLIMGFLIEPALQLRLVRKARHRVAVIVDHSRSMSLLNPDNRSRHESVIEFLGASKSEIEALHQKRHVSWFDLEQESSLEHLQLPPQGDETELIAALEKPLSQSSGPLAAIVLFSDGADTGVLGEGRDAAFYKELSARIKVPINTVNVVPERGFKDVWVKEIIKDNFAFIHNTMEVEAVIEMVGYEAATVPISIKRNGLIVDTQEVLLTPKEPSRVRFKSKPDLLGEFVYSVHVPTFAGEALLHNNQQSFVLKIVRDKIRVLQVAGRPSWDERFLRQHLKENPNIDLISFFILRTPTDQSSVSEKELSLIPFPVEKLFTSELDSFDVVIFQNFDFRPYRMAHYLPNIRRAVQNGLGFVMLGGEQSFGGGGYANSPLKEIIPVEMTQDPLMLENFRPVPSQAGRRHPISTLTNTGPSLDYWQNIPAWQSYNHIAEMKPEAIALLEHPKQKTQSGKPLPLVTVMEAGEGRSMAIATNSLWRWRFHADNNAGQYDRLYHRFWSNALRWLVKDPEHSRIRLRSKKKTYKSTEKIVLDLHVQGKSYEPIAFAEVDIQILAPDQSMVAHESVSTGEQGHTKVVFESLPEGQYSVIARAQNVFAEIGKGSTVFVVENLGIELNDIKPRPDILRALSQASGGRAFQLGDAIWDDLAFTAPKVEEIDRRQNIELWDNFYALIAAIGLLAADWFVRRRSGFI
ncbi:MAG: hypothetical protein QGI45_03125 [Myxococcota bacterium]|nr:hypothetical protein [Myxococcota bacterium]